MLNPTKIVLTRNVPHKQKLERKRDEYRRRLDGKMPEHPASTDVYLKWRILSALLKADRIDVAELERVLTQELRDAPPNAIERFDPNRFEMAIDAIDIYNQDIDNLTLF